MQQQSTFFSLEQVIDRQPLTVSPQTPLQEVISLMHEWGNSCTFDDAQDLSSEDNTAERNNSCVLITQDNRLQGIFTERDLVKLVAKKADTNSVTVSEMMVSDVVTLALKEDTDIFAALSLLRKHRIRHLPIVDTLNNLIGLVTAKSLRQKLQPINLMRWREVSEVMNTEVVYTSGDDSVINVAVLMAEHDISCVAICELDQINQSDSVVSPVGIITERDIVQFQNLGIDLEQPARNLMSTPLFLVSPIDSLWKVYQQMKQRRVRRLLVADERGKLTGIITQTSLLQIFDPSEMYGVIEVLQRQVCQLENEREKLLQERNDKLKQEIEEHTADIVDKNQQLQLDRARLRQSQTEYEQQLQFERLITKISARFLTVSAEQLATEMQFALETISKFIQVETSYVFRFAEDYRTFSMTHEWSTLPRPFRAGSGLTSSVPEIDPQIGHAQNLPESLFPWMIALIKQGKTISVNNVSELPPAAATDRKSWQNFKIKSLLIIPYKEHERIVGWLSFVSFSQEIIWSPGKINLLQVVGEILASTLQRQQASLALQASEQKFNSILSSLKDIVWSSDAQTREILYINSAVETICGRQVAEFYQHPQLWSEIVHPEDRARVNNFEQCLIDSGSQEIEYRILRPDGEVRWILDRAQVIYDENNQPLRLDGIASDISDRKQTELEIRKFVSLADNSSEFIGMCDLNLVPFYINQAGKQLVGLDQPGQYSEVAVEDFFFPEDRAWIFEQFFPQVLHEGQGEAEVRFRHFQTGAALWMIYSVHLIEDENGHPIALATQSRDITDRKQTESKIRQQAALLDLTHDTVLVRNLESTITFWNKGAIEMYGWHTSEALGKNSHQLLKANFPQSLAEIETVLFRREYWSGEFTQQKKDGTELTILGRWSLLKDRDGNPAKILEINHDISDRKQAEADLAKSNQILQAISSIQTQYLTDAEPQILFDVMLAHLLELTESEYGFIGEIQFAADGSPTMEEGYLKRRGRPYLKTHAITNIAWNESTKAFYAANAPKGMEFHNLETLFGAVMVTGEPVIANSPSTDPRSGGIPQGHPDLKAFLGVPFYKNNKMTGMVGIANRQGGYDEALVHYLRPFLDTCSRIIEAYRSDRQRQQAEAKIREQAALLDIANEAIMVRDADDQILFWNRGAEKLYGWSKAEALNKNAQELFNRKSTVDLSKIHQAVRERGEWQGELYQVTKTDQEIVVNSRWTLVKDRVENPQAYLVVKTDITEQKQLEAQFLRTQRLESLGTLAGGIAHDLNNILAPILGFSKLLPLKLTNVDEQTKGFFKIMENNAHRGTALVKQILTFSRGLEGEKGIVQIRHLITEIGQIIQETFPKSIELELNAPKNLWTVNADVNQLHQVLMNLSVNARDAMADGGRLTIDAENTMLNAEYARLHLDATEGAYVLITVRDTGIGISPEIIDRIFEPFFTTKKVGQGTGLGLSTVIGIIKSHGGFVEVVSNKNQKKGTQFKVFLPASDTAENNIEESEEILHGNGELILVVDDETAILEVTKATLETYNYQVLTASDGIEAIATYAQNQQDINAVIMDIMMPSMDGKTAIRTLKKINTKAKIIAVSGLIERQEIVADLDGDVITFINKPYDNDNLLQILREILKD